MSCTLRDDVDVPYSLLILLFWVQRYEESFATQLQFFLQIICFSRGKPLHL